MTSESPSPEQSYRDYHKFYQARNPQDQERYQRQVKDYQRQFGAVLKNTRKSSALDVGCATGMLAGWLVQAGFAQVAGVDLNPALIAQARERVPQAQFACGDAAGYLRTGRQFEIIFLLNVVEHISREQLVDFMGAVSDALLPGGAAVIRTPNLSHIMAAGHLADDLTHCTGLTEQSLSQLAQLAGFAQVEFLNQFAMQNGKGKLKALLSWPLHRFLWWLRGGTKPRVIYRNLYARLAKS